MACMECLGWGLIRSQTVTLKVLVLGFVKRLTCRPGKKPLAGVRLKDPIGRRVPLRVAVFFVELDPPLKRSQQRLHGGCNYFTDACRASFSPLAMSLLRILILAPAKKNLPANEASNEPQKIYFAHFCPWINIL